MNNVSRENFIFLRPAFVIPFKDNDRPIRAVIDFHHSSNKRTVLRRNPVTRAKISHSDDARPKKYSGPNAIPAVKP